MVRVFKCHSFASQSVIPITKEPLTFCADNDKVFVATSDCEFIVFRVSDGISTEVQRCPTISQVEKIVYNSFRNYIVTVELKKSWKRVTRSVRVYLNWNASLAGNAKRRTKVRVAGKSHVQHVSGGLANDVMEIVEVLQEGNVTTVSVCRYTGNFAVASGMEVKLCSVVEKTIANSDKTYLDVEVFLELCWNFPIHSISICEEFIVCCSHKEVQGIRVRFDEGEKKPQRKLLSTSSSVVSDGGHITSASSQELFDSSRVSSGSGTPQSVVSETLLFSDHLRGMNSLSPDNNTGHSEFRPTCRPVGDIYTPVKDLKDFSTVGMRPSKQSPKLANPCPLLGGESNIVDDECFVEWNFQQGEVTPSGSSVCLPGLHSGSMQSQCYLHAHIVSPPVLSDFSGGKVRSVSGVHAETVLHLNDPLEKEEWLSIILIPTYSADLSSVLISSVNTDRMRSSSSASRTSMCCYVSGNRGGYLYQLSPLLTQVSVYKYTDVASQVGISQRHLHVVTHTGIETYTSRWGVVSMEMQENEDEEFSQEQIHPPSTLDICLCGHEPFLGASTLSLGADFLALLSKVEDPSGAEEVHWSLYILHCFSLVDMYKDMFAFARRIQVTGPASYIHMLQEAHLLLSTSPQSTVVGGSDVKECLRQVCQLLGEFYAQPGQEDWALCWPYYRSAGTALQDIVVHALEQTEKHSICEFGKGVLDCLDHILFSHNEDMDITSHICDKILKMYAVSAPEKLSQVILLSSLKNFSTDKAYHHLKTWLSLKSSADQPISAVDKLAVVQLQLTRCEVESACSELQSIHKASLINECSSHPALIHDNLSTFTPLAQLMRQHMSGTLVEILVAMLDKSVMSLDSLLTLLKSQTDLPNNNHVREVLEMVLMDEKRTFLFEESVQMLADIYIAKIRDTSQPPLKQLNTAVHQKFSLLLLCSPHLSGDVAHFVLEHIRNAKGEGGDGDNVKDTCWDSIRLLCLTKLDVSAAIDQVVNTYPSICSMFATTCLNGSTEKYDYLLRSLEGLLKKFVAADGNEEEEVYVKAYKDLLSRMAELFPPTQFIELLPGDGNLYFLLPYLSSNMNLHHSSKLKQKIVDMGQELMSQI